MSSQGFLIVLHVPKLKSRRYTDRVKRNKNALLKRLDKQLCSSFKQAFYFGQMLEESREAQESLPPNTMAERLSQLIHSASKKSRHLFIPSKQQWDHPPRKPWRACGVSEFKSSEMKHNFSYQDGVMGGPPERQGIHHLAAHFSQALPMWVKAGGGIVMWPHPARTESEEANVRPDPHYLSEEQGTYTYRYHRLWTEKLRDHLQWVQMKPCFPSPE